RTARILRFEIATEVRCLFRVWRLSEDGASLRREDPLDIPDLERRAGRGVANPAPDDHGARGIHATVDGEVAEDIALDRDSASFQTAVKDHVGVRGSKDHDLPTALAVHQQAAEADRATIPVLRRGCGNVPLDRNESAEAAVHNDLADQIAANDE